MQIACANDNHDDGGNDLMTQFDLAQSLETQGNHDAAIKVYKDLIKEHAQTLDDKSLARLNYEIGYSQSSIVTNELPNDEKLHETYQYFSNAARLDPDESHYLRFKGTFLSYLGAYEQAEKTFKKMALLEGEDAHWSKVRLGGLYRKLGKLKKSLDTFDSISENSNHTMPVNYHRALTLIKLENYQLAINSLEAGIEHQKDYGYAYTVMACAKAKLGENEDALKDFRNGMKIIKQHKNAELDISPGQKHDERQNLRNEKHLVALANGSAQLTPAIKQSLCFGSWWQTHYEKIRPKSPLLK
jgi:tetratricopeptide (TPR) repeat protein